MLHILASFVFFFNFRLPLLDYENSGIKLDPANHLLQKFEQGMFVEVVEEIQRVEDHYSSDEPKKLRHVACLADTCSWVSVSGIHTKTLKSTNYLADPETPDERDPWCEAVKAIIDAYPDAASIADSCGEMPLHHLLRNNCLTLRRVNLILGANPEAVCKKDQDGLYPLMKASQNISAMRDNVAEVIGRLTEVFPEAARMRDMNGEMALHHFLRVLLTIKFQSPIKSIPVDIMSLLPVRYLGVVDTLLRANPEAAMMRDKDGVYPLRLAMSIFDTQLHKDTNNLFQSLMSACPELHFILDKNSVSSYFDEDNVNKIRDFFMKYPLAASIKDEKSGRFALHAAAKYYIVEYETLTDVKIKE